ncbi:hypothetical protein EW145_g2113 [Phellinidium pouzarii]|uniref:Uncharacterized protein n=1 Tax=Phellinidium pouzarii TaxID=167371 RepID=A0A4S4LC35_9AGAM|nr:hypothetical protein EW145_g2113 [Phellinidium pouzarii]
MSAYELRLIADEERTNAYKDMPIEQLIDEEFTFGRLDHDPIRWEVLLFRFPAAAVLFKQKKSELENPVGNHGIAPSVIMLPTNFVDVDPFQRDERGIYEAQQMRKVYQGEPGDLEEKSAGRTHTDTSQEQSPPVLRRSQRERRRVIRR